MQTKLLYMRWLNLLPVISRRLSPHMRSITTAYAVPTMIPSISTSYAVPPTIYAVGHPREASPLHLDRVCGDANSICGGLAVAASYETFLNNLNLGEYKAFVKIH